MSIDPVLLAIHDQGTLFEVTRVIVSATADVDELMRRVARTVRERHQYGFVLIYLSQPDGGLRLAGGAIGSGEPNPGALDDIINRVAALSQSRVEAGGRLWRVAVPVRDDGSLLGVIALGLDGPVRVRGRTVMLAETLAGQIAVGIQSANLHQRQIDLASQLERARIAREIHDGIAQSMYALNLELESCAIVAEQDDDPLRERLQNLVGLARNTLLDMRSYIYDLSPIVPGEETIATLVEMQTREFQSISGISVRLDIQGELPELSASVCAGLHRILQAALGNVLRHAVASEVIVALAAESGSVRLSVKDNGIGFDPEHPTLGYGLSNMRHRAEDMGGTFEVSSAIGAGTEGVVRVPVPGVPAR